MSFWGYIRIKLIIDGKPFFFLIDTGANCNSIIPEAAELLKDRIRVLGKRTARGYVGKMTEKEIEIQFRFNHQNLVQRFTIMKDTRVFRNMESEGCHFDGILGTPFLYASKATIDFADLVIRMDRNRKQKELRFVLGRDLIRW